MPALIPLGQVRKKKKKKKKKTYHVRRHRQIDQSIGNMQLLGKNIEDWEIYIR